MMRKLLSIMGILSVIFDFMRHWAAFIGMNGGLPNWLYPGSMIHPWFKYLNVKNGTFACINSTTKYPYTPVFSWFRGLINGIRLLLTWAVQHVLSRCWFITHHTHVGAQTGAGVEPVSTRRPVLGLSVLPLPLGEPRRRHEGEQSRHADRDEP